MEHLSGQAWPRTFLWIGEDWETCPSSSPNSPKYIIVTISQLRPKQHTIVVECIQSSLLVQNAEFKLWTKYSLFNKRVVVLSKYWKRSMTSGCLIRSHDNVIIIKILFLYKSLCVSLQVFSRAACVWSPTRLRATGRRHSGSPGSPSWSHSYWPWQLSVSISTTHLAYRQYVPKRNSVTFVHSVWALQSW